MLHGIPLSPREWQIARLVSQGCPYKEVAAQMGLSAGTVKGYANRLFRKIDAYCPEERNRDYRIMLTQWVIAYQREQAGKSEFSGEESPVRRTLYE